MNNKDKGGMNNKGKDTIQQELFNASGDEGALKALVNRIYESRSPLNVNNIATILHRTAKKRILLPADVTDFLASRLEGSDTRERMTAQNVGSAVYGLQRMGDSHAEVRQLVAALATKVQNAGIDPQAVGNGM